MNREKSIMDKLREKREKDEEKGIFVCPYCNGTGIETNSYKGHTEIEDCIFCEGRGRLIIPEVIIEKIKRKEREKLLEKQLDILESCGRYSNDEVKMSVKYFSEMLVRPAFGDSEIHYEKVLNVLDEVIKKRVKENE